MWRAEEYNAVYEVLIAQKTGMSEGWSRLLLDTLIPSSDPQRLHIKHTKADRLVCRL